MAPALELNRLRKRFSTVAAVDDVSLTLAPGEFVTLLGPSGSGKTSTLRLIGGFEQADAVEIRINGQRADRLPPYLRDTATIFQSGALFPHKTVAENVAFGLRMRQVPRSDIDKRITEVLAIVRLDGFGARYPNQLSGGQKQRVALARSLVVRPAVLLFDEPLSALDLSLRLQLRAEIRKLHEEIGFSAIYVTHDQGEAMALSDRVAVMNHGRIEQIDRPDIVYDAAATEFVHSFVGESACLPVIAADDGFRDARGVPLALTLAVPLMQGAHRIYLRPSRLLLGEGAQAAANRFTTRVETVEYLGEHWRYHLVSGAARLIADHPKDLGLHAGAGIDVGWDTGAMRVFA